MIASGEPEEVMRHPESLTGQYLTGLRQIEVPRHRREGHPGQEIRILGATENNLRDLDVRFSITARQHARMRRLIEAIPEADWRPIPYWMADGADVAETTWTPFAADHADAVPVRLIVRRVRPSPGTQLALFSEFTYHPFITDREGDTLELEAAHRRQYDRLAEEQADHLPPGRPQRTQQADLGGAFVDRYGHDRQDADTADQQRDRTQCTDRQRQHVQNRSEHLKHLVLGDDREVLVAVPCDQAAADLFGQYVGISALLIQDVDLHQAVAVEHRHRATDRDVDRVIEIEAEHLSLGFHASDNAVGLSTDADTFTER